MSNRQIALDTETTGLSTSDGHRIIEIGCVELVNRRLTGREFHRFLDPERDIDEGAERVHGISRAELVGKPKFAEVVDEFLEFIRGSELVIHNAAFDIGFLDNELSLLKHKPAQIVKFATVLDTLSLAREMHPGQRNNLDALCKRYGVDTSNREVHGALIDADLLARVYLAMTGGQTALLLDSNRAERDAEAVEKAKPGRAAGLKLVVKKASDAERLAHERLLDDMAESGKCLWRELESVDSG